MPLGDVLWVDDTRDGDVRVGVDLGAAVIGTVVIPRHVYLTLPWETFGRNLAARQAAELHRLKGAGQ